MQNEPDRVEWTHDGMPCLAVRHETLGHWCGYVAVHPNHPLHGKGYEFPELEVHGGLTYAGACHGKVCHVPKSGEPDNVWWFGFDCAHSGDLSPGMNRFGSRLASYESYKTLAYVQRETNRLAEQLVKVEV